MNWVLIGCIAVMVSLGLIGLKLGVVKMLYHLAAFALALVITAILAPMVSKIVVRNDSPSVERVKEKVVKTLRLDEIDFGKTVSKDILDDLKIPKAVRDELAVFNTKDNYEQIGAEDAKDYVATSIAVIILQSVVYLVVFLVVWLIVFMVFHALDLIAKVPGLRAANRLAGMTVGLILAACVILLFFILVTALSNLPAGQNMLASIEENSVLKFWYDNNPLNGGSVYLSSKFK